MSFDRQRFVFDLRALVAQGVMFRHQGRDPETGLDCIHAPAWAYKAQGLQFPPELEAQMKNYSEAPNGWRMMEIMRQWFQEIPVIDNQVPDAEPGDLLQVYVRRNPQHVAVITELNPIMVIEAYRCITVKIGQLTEQPLRWRIAACFRIPDFEN